MARFAFYSHEGLGLSWARRLCDEGHEVAFYVEKVDQKKCGENLVPKINNLEDLFAWAKSKPGTIAFFDYSESGEQAEAFRKAGIPVVGGGAFCDRLEMDRAFGMRVASVCGIKMPETHDFPTISDAQRFIEDEGGDWYFKTDRYLESDATCGGDSETLGWHLQYFRETYGDRVRNIMQKKIEGTALSTSAWFNGNVFLRPFQATIEHKKFLNDDLGPSMGCSINVVWEYEKDYPRIASELNWSALEGVFRAQHAPAGTYDINAIVNETGAYFLEWCGRCGYDSETTSQLLLDAPLGEFLVGLAHGTIDRAPFTTKDVAFGARLSVSPYPHEKLDGLKKTCEEAPIHGQDGLWDGYFVGYSVAAKTHGELYVADRMGAVGVAVDRGRSLKKIHKATIEYLHTTLHAPGLQYRTDGDTVLATDAKKLKALGYEIPAGVLE